MTSSRFDTENCKIAGIGQHRDLTIVGTEGEFAEAIVSLLSEIRPKTLIETGTYKGTGTTSIIAAALQRLGLDDAVFFSIEVNPKNYSQALAHIERNHYPVRLLNGLSVPRALLPTRDQIDAELVRSTVEGARFVDHAPEQRAELYFRETDFSFLPDDLLAHALSEMGGRPDFVLLDSGGHMGFVEFQYLIERLTAPCIIALDDIDHVKHARSFRQVMTDQRFTVRQVSREKFGFCIAHFTPQPAGKRKELAA